MLSSGLRDTRSALFSAVKALYALFWDEGRAIGMTAGGKRRTIGIGVVGLGGATRQILPSLSHHDGVRIVAGSDLRPEARARFADEFGVAVYESVEQLCAGAGVDAVYIATPHQFHKEHTLLAAAAGKHVIVEKPMALTLADCDAMIAAARAAGVHLIVGHTHSFNAPIVAMREIVRSGELGAVAMINTWNYGSFLYRPRRPEELRTDLGGGIVFNQVPHQVDIVRLLGGGKVRSVRSMAWALDPARPTEGSHVSFLQFESGAAASLVYSGYDRFDSDEFHFWIGEMGQEKAHDTHGAAWSALQTIGEGEAEAKLKSARAYGGDAAQAAGNEGRWHQPHFGVTIVSCERGDMRQSQDGVTVYRPGGKIDVPVPRPRAYPDKGGVFDELYRAVTSGEAPLHDGAWGKATLEVCLAILRSAHERREIVLEHQVAAD